MSDLERALRGAFALDAVPTPGAGFEARMARAARERGRTRAGPIVLAALVAGAAAATLAIARDAEHAPAAPRLAMWPTTAPAAVRPGDGSSSFTEVWQLVIRVQRSFSLSVDDAATGDSEDSIEREATDDDQPPPPPRERRRHHPVTQPTIDCGNDPLCPLVAPNAARLRVATREGGWGRVYLDGQDAGATPLDIEVIPGRHRLTVLDGNGQTRTLTIDLEPGERRHLQITMPRPARHPDPR